MIFELVFFLCRHLLVVFGGPDGLESSLQLDEALEVDNVRDFFPIYLNTCPDQGSRTIRTEVSSHVLKCLVAVLENNLFMLLG